MGHSGCMLKSVMLPLASNGTWGWGWKSRKGDREKVLWHKNHLSVLFYCHLILAKPCTFTTYTFTNEMRPSRGLGMGTCFLVPLEKMALFPKNKILILYVPCSPKLRKLLHIKVTPDLHLTYSKNGGNLGLVLKLKNIACLSILLTKHVKYTYLYLFKFVLYSIVAFKAS